MNNHNIIIQYKSVMGFSNAIFYHLNNAVRYNMIENTIFPISNDNIFNNKCAGKS